MMVWLLDERNVWHRFEEWYRPTLVIEMPGVGQLPFLARCGRKHVGTDGVVRPRGQLPTPGLVCFHCATAP